MKYVPPAYLSVLNSCIFQFLIACLSIVKLSLHTMVYTYNIIALIIFFSHIILVFIFLVSPSDGDMYCFPQPFFILMDFSINIDIIRMGLPIVYLNGPQI